MTSLELQLLTTKTVQEYIRANEMADEKKLVLSAQKIAGLSAALIATQIDLRRKAKTKLPTWYRTTNIIYPAVLNIEQCSSEATAIFKASILKRNLDHSIRVADLTGGFGVDSFFLAHEIANVEYVEKDNGLAEIARHNHQVLGRSNIKYHNGSAEEFWTTTWNRFDAVYIDPSRRDERGQKTILLDKMDPNMMHWKSFLFKKTEVILLKASPLLDIQRAILELKNVAQVWVVSVANECKELLFLMKKKVDNDPIIRAVNLSENGKELHHFSFSFEEEKNTEPRIGSLCEYVYEPNASIMKAGAFKVLASRYDLYKTHPNTHLYTSSTLVADFPGRIFKIVCIQPTDSQWKQFLPEGKANVITRNYPLSAEALKKKLKLKDGGEKYVIGLIAGAKKIRVIAQRIK